MMSIFNKSRPQKTPFVSTHRVDVYDQHEEKKSGAPVKIAEASTDGKQGKLTIMDDRFEAVLRPLFTHDQLVLQGGGESGGVFADGGPTKLKPWQWDTLQHVVNHELKIHQLRAEIVDTTPKKKSE
jgi:hypothetical protein